jgi:hypothetical protein
VNLLACRAQQSGKAAHQRHNAEKSYQKEHGNYLLLTFLKRKKKLLEGISNPVQST